LCGCGVTNPQRDSTRQIVAVDGADPRSVARCTAMVAAPASRPCSDSFLRQPTIASSTSTAVRAGLWCGRLDRGASPASPSVSKRPTSSCTHRREIRYSRATALDSALRAAFHPYRGDDQTCQGHRFHPNAEVFTMSRHTCALCHELRHLRARRDSNPQPLDPNHCPPGLVIGGQSWSLSCTNAVGRRSRLVTGHRSLDGVFGG
jgi:hypothetical protein